MTASVLSVLCKALRRPVYRTGGRRVGGESQIIASWSLSELSGSYTLNSLLMIAFGSAVRLKGSVT